MKTARFRKEGNLEQVLSDYRAGVTQDELKRKYGIHHKTLTGLLAEYSTPLRTSRFKLKDHVSDITDAYLRGAEIKELCEKYSVAKSSINRLLKKQGVAIRPAGKLWKIRDQIVSSYKSGRDIYQIMKDFDVGFVVVDKAIKESGIFRRPYGNYHGLEEKIITEYLEGATAVSLAKKYNIDKSAPFRLLEERGLNRRTMSESNRKYSIDHNYLDCIDSEEKAYFLGFMYADGYNGYRPEKKQYHIKMHLHTKDAYILEQFRVNLKSERPIIYRYKESADKYHEQAGLDISSRRLSERLNELGCHRAKSFTLMWPEWLTDDLAPHFIRGYIDGDGWITDGYTKSKRKYEVRKFTIGAIGSDAFIEKLRTEWQRLCGVSSHIARHPVSKGISSVIISGRLQSKKAVNFLYKDATIYLTRKKEVADVILNYKLKVRQGESANTVKTSKDSVLAIKDLLLSGHSLVEASRITGVPLHRVTSISKGETWRSVTEWNSVVNGKRGRIKGTKCHAAKLDDSKVTEIKEMILSGIPDKEIADRFGVTQTNIQIIRKGRGWRHVTGFIERPVKQDYFKITPDDIPNIYAMLDSGMTLRAVGMKFGVSDTHILRIKRKRQEGG